SNREGEWTPRRATFFCSPPCRSSAQASPGLWMTSFSARSLPRSVPSPLSTPQDTGTDMSQLILKRASASRSSGEWSDDDYDVLCEGEVVGRIFNAASSPVGSPWMWTLIFPHHEDRTPIYGYEATREAAM